MKVLIIIPMYNEEKNVKVLYKKILDFNVGQGKNSFDFLFINDASTDGTEKELLSCGANYVSHSINLGIGGGVQTGYKYAYSHGYDIAVQMDGDCQHDPSFLPALIQPLETGECNMVIGSRFESNKLETFKSTFLRRIGIRVISIVIYLKTGKWINDTTSGFRAIDRNLIREFSVYYPLEYPEPISSVFALKKGFKIYEIPVVMNERKFGTSSIKRWKSIYYMINVILSIILL